ncbi:MAG: PKD domain-containing protein [Thermoleophilaceae bacterium]|nr:PKD domain-containing protein [Thermoleophilaceae bacterium]
MCAAALLLALIGASSASADLNICVGNDVTNACPAGSTAATDLADAATKATDISKNSIYVTSGVYGESSASGVNFVGKPVDIYGVGATRPILTLAPIYTPGTSVLFVGSNATIDNIQIDIPASSGLTGITSGPGGQFLKNITINGPAATASKGFVVDGSAPHIRGVTIDLGGSGSSGIRVLPGSTGALLEDVNVTHATTAVTINGVQNFTISRMKSRSAFGLASSQSSGTISSSVLMPSAVGAENSGGKAVDASATSAVPEGVRVANCTLIGGGTGTTGVSASGAGALPVVVNSSVISGFETATNATGSGTISVEYSRFTSQTLGATTVAGTSQLTGPEMGFVNASADNYRLQLSSPLVDAGDPTPANSNDSGTDADDQSRIVSRGAGKIRDIGAYEVQNSAPVPRIQVVTPVPSTTSNTLFSAAGSTDTEGDELTYSWKFDGAPSNGGATTQKMFATEGPHSVSLTVSDRSGASASTSTQFNVARGFLAIKLRSQNATISKKGTFKITMSCPVEAISNCSGRLLFQTTKKVVAQNYTKRPGWAAAAKSKKPAYLQAARYVFSIAPGTTQKLEVRTYSTFQNVLGVHKKFQIQSSLVSGTTGNASLTANRATFTIRAPKSSKK